jgi:hypothetical protein
MRADHLWDCRVGTAWGRSFERLFFVGEHRRDTHGCKQVRHETTSLNLRLTRAQGWAGINVLVLIAEDRRQSGCDSEWPRSNISMLGSHRGGLDALEAL